MEGQEGLDEVRALQEGGFSDDEINAHVVSTRAEMQEAGFTAPETDHYFGIPQFNPQPLQKHFEQSFESFATGRAKELLSTSEGAPPAPEPVYTPSQAGRDAPPAPEADSFVKAVEAGFQISATGLIARRGKSPDYDVSDEADWYMRIAKQVGMVAGDIPANIMGGLIASPTGLVAGPGAPIAAIVAAGAGANALPAAIRSMYVHHLNNGEVADFKDFWTKASAVFLDTMKAAAVGGVTMGVGGKVAGKVGTALVDGATVVTKPILNTTAKLASEVGTMVTLGKALDGEVPKFRDFADAAILVAGLHGASKLVDTMRGPVPVIAESQVDTIRGGNLTTQEKLQQIYAKTGIKPAEVAQQAMKDPVLKQQLLTNSMDIPDAYKPFVDPKADETTQKFAVPDKMGDGDLVVRKPNAPVDAYEATAKAADVPPPVGEQSAIDTPKDTFKNFLFEETGSAGKPPPPAPELSDAEKAVVARIGTEDKPSRLPTFDEMYTAALNDLHPIGQFVEATTGGAPIKTAEDAHILARLTRGNAGRATNFIENGPRDFDTLRKVPGAKGLKEILKPVAANLDGLRAYMVSARDAELIPRGVKVGEGKPAELLKNAQQVLSDGKAKFEPVAQELYAYQNALTDYLVKAGIVAKESSDAFKSLHQHYIPFYRIMEEETPRGAGKGMQVKNPIRQMLGSERELVDPIESVIRNTFTYVELAERNRMLRAAIDTGLKHGAGPEFIERVLAPTKPIEVTPEEINRFNKEFGIGGEVAGQAMTVFRPIQQDLAPDQIALFRGGKREVYRVPEEVATAIKDMDAGTAGLFMKWMAAPAKALRAGTILEPAFALKNFLRDQIYATMFSKNGYIPVFSALEGMKEILTDGPAYQDWLAGGGGGANLVSMDRQYINNHVLRLDPVQGVLGKMWNVAKSPIELARVASELVENSTRVGEFKLAMKGTAGKRSDIFNAAYESREVTLDFSRMGAKTQAFNQITAFFNAQLQGLDRIGRAFKEDPMGMSAKITAAVTVPSVALWWANHTDPRWKEIPRWQKDLAWIIMTDNWQPATRAEAGAAGASFTRVVDGELQINKGHIFRIPKPNEVGVMFGSMIERTLDAFFDKEPAAYKDFMASMAQTFTPAYTPTALIPVIEQFSNKSTFTGSPIVPGHLEKGLPEVQYTEYTSETAKLLGKLIAPVAPKIGDLSVASPAVIDNYLRAWTGTMGSDVVAAIDKGLYKSGLVPEPPRPTAALSDMPIIKAFVVRYPAANARSIVDFQEKYQEHSKLMNTVAIKTQKGDLVGAMQMRFAQENRTALANIDGFHMGLNRIKLAIERLDQNPQVKPDEKRQLVDGMYFQMIELAKAGNKLVDAFGAAIQPGAKK